MVRLSSLATLLMCIAVASCANPADTQPQGAGNTGAPGKQVTTDAAPGDLDVAANDPLALNIPLPVRGKWREIDPSSVGDAGPEPAVTAAQCDSSDYSNAGQILTIGAKQFSWFESGGRLTRVHERSASRIRATFDTTYADTPTTGDYTFDAQDGGKSLVMREYGENARPGPMLYKRCPE